MRKRGLSLGTQKKQLGHVNAVLKFVGNAAISRMKAKNPHMMPRGRYVRGPSLNPDQLSKVLRSAESMKGWHGEVARFIIGVYAFTGLRMSELRMARYQDLDNWTLRVRHPKGEGSYDEFRSVPLPSPVRPIVERFLIAREKMLADKGILSSEPLIPRQRGQRGDDYYSANQFEQICSEVRKASGVDFDFRTLRRTYGQNLLNRGVELPTVSLMLGHASTVTTEKYYCRKDADSARLEVLKAFDEPVVRPSLNTARIDGKTEFTGYV
ncbi:MAG: tyrosine-type recombinase/integrase, partial [Thermoplasmata archaeon]